MDGNQGGWLDR